MKVNEDDDFGEGETEDTQPVKNELEVYVDPKAANGTRLIKKTDEPIGFASPYDKKLLQTYP